MDPLASYYAGLAWERARDRERAEDALRRVEEQAPGSDWAQQAALALDRLGEPYQKHWWTDIVAGVAYDDNVVLQGDNVVLPEEISNERDGVVFWSLEGGYEFLRNPNWSLGAVAGYMGNAYFDLNEFNTQYPNISLWVDRRLDDASFVRLKPFFGYVWRDADSYLGAVGGNLAYFRRYDSSYGRLYGEVLYDDYLYSIPDDGNIAAVIEAGGGTLDPAVVDALLAGNERLKRVRDRDGVQYEIGYEHVVEVGERTEVTAGTDFYHYEAQGDEWTHRHVGVWLGLRRDLVWKLSLDVVADYAYEPYRKASSFLYSVPKALSPELMGLGPDRRDNIWGVSVLLERPILSWLKASLSWRYQDNDSNTDVFDYDRHIAGGFLTASFGE
jgi:hypothetical protein